MRPNALLAIAVLALTACSPNPEPASNDTKPQKPLSSGSASPSPSSTEQPVDPNILFTITATLLGPDGATAELKQVVYRPIAQSADPAAVALFDDPDYNCGAWKTDIPGAMFLDAIVTVTDTSPDGSAWGDTDFGLAYLSSGGRTRYSGAWGHTGAPCDTPAYVSLGETTTISLVNPNSADETYGWASHEYGFGAQPDENGMTLGVSIENCALDISDFALANSAGTHNWPGQANDSTSCLYGEELYGIY